MNKQLMLSNAVRVRHHCERDLSEMMEDELTFGSDTPRFKNDEGISKGILEGGNEIETEMFWVHGNSYSWVASFDR